jgi:hypothetical protein
LLTKGEITRRIIARAELDVILERRGQSVEGESFAQFNDDNKPTISGITRWGTRHSSGFCPRRGAM